MASEETKYYCVECGHEVIPVDEEQTKMCEEDGDNVLCEECYEEKHGK